MIGLDHLPLIDNCKIGNCKLLIAILEIIVLTIYLIILNLNLKNIWYHNVIIYIYFYRKCNCPLLQKRNWSKNIFSVNTLRRAFQIEMTAGSSIFTQSKTSMLIETTTNVLVPVFKDKIGNYNFELMTKWKLKQFRNGCVIDMYCNDSQFHLNNLFLFCRKIKCYIYAR